VTVSAQDDEVEPLLVRKLCDRRACGTDTVDECGRQGVTLKERTNGLEYGLGIIFVERLHLPPTKAAARCGIAGTQWSTV
jgi:hypothetical protein